MDNNDMYFNYIKWQMINKGLTWEKLALQSEAYDALDLVMMCMGRKKMSQDIYNKLASTLGFSNENAEFHFLKAVKKHNLEHLRLRSDFTMNLIQYFMLYDIAILGCVGGKIGYINANFLSEEIRPVLTFNNNVPNVTLKAIPSDKERFTPTCEPASLSDFTKSVMQVKDKAGMTFEAIAQYLGYSQIDTIMMLFQRKLLSPDDIRRLQELFHEYGEIKYPSRDLLLIEPTYNAQVLSDNTNPHPLLFSLYKAICLYGEALMELIHDNNASVNISEISNFKVYSEVSSQGKTLLGLSFDIIVD